MKKPHLHILVILTAVFASFTLGLFVGRNQTAETVVLSVPASLQTTPPETTASTEAPAETASPITFPIDINTATKEEFMALPGIGEVLAERILAYREEHGAFSAAEGLMNVEGIGEKKIENMLDLITIGG